MVDKLTEGAVTVLVLILVVAVGATVLQTIRGTQAATTNAVGVNDTNNPITLDTDDGNVTFGIPGIYVNPTLSSFVVVNATNGSQIYDSGNYTINADNTAFSWDTATANETTVNWSFAVNFDVLNQDFNVTTAGLSALVTYSDFFTVIVVILVFAVIIGLFAFFTLRGRGSSI